MGKLGDIGSYGYSWSSTIKDSFCIFLYFTPQHLASCNEHYRAYGYQLRCLSE
ncbi:hypothetical protein [uncultured Rikenella sp.]|uniref:hypothetical protein n=1 Tax=uncultured Rikenella sp. TaxID=368003 RepID=UPI00262DA674|nr:hypothetical protein [uncultured Rikenella sp.]